MLNKISCVHLERASGDLLIRGVRCRGISHGRTKVPRGVSLSYPLSLAPLRVAEAQFFSPTTAPAPHALPAAVITS